MEEKRYSSTKNISTSYLPNYQYIDIKPPKNAPQPKNTTNSIHHHHHLYENAQYPSRPIIHTNPAIFHFRCLPRFSTRLHHLLLATASRSRRKFSRGSRGSEPVRIALISLISPNRLSVRAPNLPYKTVTAHKASDTL